MSFLLYQSLILVSENEISLHLEVVKGLEGTSYEGRLWTLVLRDLGVLVDRRPTMSNVPRWPRRPIVSWAAFGRVWPAG